MIFLFDEEAGKELLSIKNENFKYLFKVRRHNVEDIISFRNPKNPLILYSYKVTSIQGRHAFLKLEDESLSIVKANKNLHLAWCVIDPKSVEKVLPSLNELGVDKITFIYCNRSQKNFKADFKRFERILLTSMQQCGRSEMMQFDTCHSLTEFIHTHPSTAMLDFCDTVLTANDKIETVLIGTEGGFCEEERTALENLRKFRLNTPLVLRSESAAVAISSILL